MTKTFTLYKSRMRNIFLLFLLAALSAHYSFAACNASFTYTVNQVQGKVYFTSASTGTSFNHYWTVNGNYLSSSANPSWTYPATGYFIVMHNVFNMIDSCQNTKTDTIFIPGPSCDAGFTHSINQAQHKIYLNGNATGNNLFHQWYVNGNYFTGQNVSWTYPAPGYYFVTHSVHNFIDSCSDTESDTIYIPQSAPCQASFNYYINPQQSKLVLNSTSTGNNLSHHWQINGTSYYGQNLSWTYPGPGYYLVSLTVFSTTDSNCFSKITDTVFIQNPNPCNASFNYTINHTQGKVYFYSSSTGSGLSHTWLINGTHYYGPNVVWTYPGPGYYNVTLSVFTGDSSCHDYEWATIYISGQDSGCNANFYFYKDSFPGTQFWFVPQMQDTFATSYLWTFGDGDSAYASYPTHQYNAPGSYRVCLTVRNYMDSCSATRCDTIVITDSVSCNVNAQFYFYKDSMNKYHFVPQYSSNATTHYYWSFGDGQTSTQKYPVHSYSPQSWYHIVCLTVMNPADSMCFDHHCDTLISVPDSGCHANAGFTYTVQQHDTVNNYKIYHFTPNYLNAAAYNYYWEFDPVATSTQPTPSYLFSTTIKPMRWVCLTVTSKTNPACKARYCDTIPVNPGCNADARFSYSKYPGGAYTYHFTSPAGNQYNHLWKFGNQSYGGTSPIYTFPGAGVYKVCHKVTKMGDTTCFDQFCDSIVIMPPPSCNSDFTYALDSMVSPRTFVFFPLYQDNTASYSWQFGDGDFSYSMYPSHTYATPGKYLVCLMVTNLADSCHSITCDSIVVSTSSGLKKDAPLSVTSMYPNPVTDELRLKLNMKVPEQIMIRVISITGQLEHEQTDLIPAGNSELQIDTRSLKQGIHFIELKGKEWVERRKFVK